MKIHRGPGRPPKNQAAEPVTQQQPEIVPEAVEPAQAPEPTVPLTPEEAARRIEEILSRLYESTRHDRHGYYRNIQFEYRHVYKQVQRAIEDVRAVIRTLPTAPTPIPDYYVPELQPATNYILRPPTEGGDPNERE